MADDDLSPEEEKKFEERVKKNQEENARLLQVIKLDKLKKKLAVAHQAVEREKQLYGLMGQGDKVVPVKDFDFNPGFDGASTDRESLEMLKKKKRALEK
ncbi:MAG: hypothetical protein WC408_05020 [Candidatus Micrarchaeia archaeon]|jgi:hypothetical protein